MTFPDFSFETKLHKEGFKLIAGIDEVGRGSFAGPVVAGCVVFSSDFKTSSFENIKVKINDSKKLTSKQREVSSIWIKENSLAWGVGEASVPQINKLGIKKASEIAFRKAIIQANLKLKSKIDYLLIDAFYISYVRGLRRKNQLAIVKGDAKSVSIAGASIVAKVYRDKLMTELGKNSKYKKYRWGKNKGYGTRDHRDMILKHGATRQHRKLFIETWTKNLGEGKKP